MKYNILYAFKAIQAIAVIRGCIPEIEDKTLLLKTPFTLDTEELNWV